MGDKIKNIFSDRQVDNLVNKIDRIELSIIKNNIQIIEKWNKGIFEKTIYKYTEEMLQSSFMINFFDKILGYKSIDFSDEYNLIFEKKTILDATKPDGCLGFFKGKEIDDVRVVIELKDASTDLDKKQKRQGDNRTPVEQAFGYASKYDNCKWIIVSNFIEIRLYMNGNQTKYEKFTIPQLLNDEKELLKFYVILKKANLIDKSKESLIDKIIFNDMSSQTDISHIFYEEYNRLRLKLFETIRVYNPYIDELIILEKTQKILDRFIFICFCENTNLLPNNLLKQALNNATNSFIKIENMVWEQLKGLFSYINDGNLHLNINRFNGGLFKEDKVLNSFKIPDDILKEFIYFEKYDFKSEIDVNILGHIFEQSISDLEEIKKNISSNSVDKYIKNIDKRKLDGIFYTPNYITKYIVKNTIQPWLNDRKQELRQSELTEIPEAIIFNDKVKDEKERRRRNRERKKRENILKSHKMFWEKYKYVLSNVKIIDYACGSGAFLNAAFDYLYHEGIIVNEKISMINAQLGELEGQTNLFDLDKEILKNNLYGVDINAESIEITKLSLWLKTANKYDPLTSLDKNIICGNSLIEDEKIEGKKAFKWNDKFLDIFQNGGFDIVIGNPPYGAKLTNEEKKYFDLNYKTTQYNYDTYKFFIELAFKITKSNSYIGLITPNTYFILEKSDLIRRFLFDNYKLREIVEVFGVFPDAVVEPVISIYKNIKPKKDDKFKVVLIPRKSRLDDNFMNKGTITYFIQDDLRQNDKYLFNYHQTLEKNNLCKKIYSISKQLSVYCNVTTGIKPYQVGKGKPKQTRETVKEKPYTGNIKQDEMWVEYVKGENIHRYTYKPDGEYIKYGEWLAEPRNPEIIRNEKLLIRQTSDKLIATYDYDGKVGKNTIHFIYRNEKYSSINLKYILGLINSKLLNWIFQYQNFHIVGKPLAETKVAYIKRLPIIISENESVVIELVDKLLEKHQKIYDDSILFLEYIDMIYRPKKNSEKLKTFYNIGFEEFINELKLQKVKLNEIEKFELMKLFNEQKKKLLQIKIEIEELEKELDVIVYSIYGLSESDINIIEGNNVKPLLIKEYI